MYILHGNGYINLYQFNDIKEFIPTQRFKVTPEDSIHIPPKQIHNIEATDNLVVLEASTNHMNDLARLKDKYGGG
jgi:mannose-6-phosphate isomerase-like protein (cupin superfamily)